ncbi:hypothetical protein QFZ87_000636 [Bacillus sp. SLBN-46]|uniref:nuclease-related domain-containing protein n=1 Tax=Bacillus sp. SLBN-46 TaxID=3042283 RepID=UPI0028639AF7|nr:nuclease-related domain-containing protein [Bacillus sp. SLBN-46]MDR6121039.1 hypothetical protein [Bacillus sp. SLBN-46]
MIAQEMRITPRMEKLEALIRRLSELNPKYPEVVAEYKRRMAGYRGEKSVYFYLTMLPNKDYLIFHGLRLFDGQYYFQMDFLLLCANFAMVLEVKNMAGELSFEKEFNQTLCKRNGTEERVKNPVLQAKLQAKKLKVWLREHNCLEIPIHYYFVNSNEKTFIKAEPRNDQMTQHICNSENVLERIDQIAAYYKNDRLDKKELKKIKRLLLTNHTPDDPNILQAYDLSPKDIPTGVQCPDCFTIPMIYKGGKWCCVKCNLTSKTAHVPTINDYFLLIKPSFTNAEICEFLHIPTIHIGYKIIKSMNLPSTGTFKNRVYHQPKS